MCLEAALSIQRQCPLTETAMEPSAVFCAPLFVASSDIMGGWGDQANDVTVEEMEAAIRREHEHLVWEQ